VITCLLELALEPQETSHIIMDDCACRVESQRMLVTINLKKAIDNC
jgi:hypothetical protein